MGFSKLIPVKVAKPVSVPKVIREINLVVGFNFQSFWRFIFDHFAGKICFLKTDQFGKDIILIRVKTEISKLITIQTRPTPISCV